MTQLTAEQASQFRRQLIAYFKENKNMLRSDVVLEPKDHIIAFKEDAQANFYDMVIPASYILTGGQPFIDATLKADLTVDITIGGLTKGDFYPAGTPLETLWRDLVTTVSLSSLTFASWKSIVEVNSNVVPNKFTWEETGDVGEVTLSDSEGNTQHATLPEQLDVLWNYTYITEKTITWSLEATHTPNGLILSTRWIYASYFGISNYLPPGAPKPIIDVNDPNRIIEIVTPSITVNLITANDEYGWIAVPLSNPIYTKWKVTELNKGSIGDGSNIADFIRYDGNISVNGVPYHLYAYNYPSEQTEPITLY